MAETQRGALMFKLQPTEGTGQLLVGSSYAWAEVLSFVGPPWNIDGRTPTFWEYEPRRLRFVTLARENVWMIGSLKTVVFDAPDIARLSEFYTSLAGWTQRYADEEWITMTTDDGWRIGLQNAPDHLAPTWPSQERPQQAHLDIRVPDIAAGTAKAISLGATLLGESERWTTLADPAGHPFDLCINADSPKTTVMGVTIDCPDAKSLSHFYSELLGKPITYEGDGLAMIGTEGDRPVLFQQVEGYNAPQWPSATHPQQIHLDIMVEEIEEAERATLTLGATRLPGEGENWRVYADPAGKPFCLLWTV